MPVSKVSIIVINWNNKENVSECLESLQQVDYPNYEIIVVDNGSTDGSPEVIKKKYPYVKLIPLDTNLGFGPACNVGINQALKDGADFVYLSNEDIIFDKMFLKNLVDIADSDDSLGIIGPIIYNYAKPNLVQEFGGYLDSRTGLVKKPDSYSIDLGQFERVRETDFIGGGACLIKRSVIEKIGLFDPAYFVYLEEVDFDYRAKKAGYRIIAASNAKIWHKMYGSYGGKLSPQAVYYMARNRIYFMRKHMSSSVLLYFYSYQLMYRIPLTILAYIKNRRFCLAQAYLKGILAGIINKVRHQKDHVIHQQSKYTD